MKTNANNRRSHQTRQKGARVIALGRSPALERKKELLRRGEKLGGDATRCLALVVQRNR